MEISEEDLILLRGSSVFDEKWYSREYRDHRWRKFDAAYHFLSTGWQIGNQPSAGLEFNFDPEDYLAVRPDVAELGVNPVAHYLACWRNERAAASLALPSDTAITKFIEYQSHDAPSRAQLQIEAELTRQSPLFDPKWYIERYPEALADGFDPRAHFLLHASEGYDPSPFFSSAWYLDSWPDVRSSGVNPLVHYLRCGHFEGRSPHPSFDADWYRRRYLAKSTQTEPLAYYLTIGSTLGQRPHPLFDPQYYLQRYEDVRSAGLDPYAHWMNSGRTEGRHGYDPATLGVGLKVCVVAHASHDDLWPQLQARLHGIPVPFELIVTMPPGSAVESVVRASWPAAQVIEHEGKGQDVASVLQVLPFLVNQGYDAVCRIHADQGEVESRTWRHMLLEGVLGSSNQIREILAWFKHDPDLVLVGARQLYLDGPRFAAANATAIEEVFRSFEGPTAPIPEKWGFLAGAMFWIRPELLRGLNRVDLTALFSDHSGGTNGRAANLTEQLFGLIATTRRRRIGLTDVSGPRATNSVDVRPAPHCTVLQELAETLRVRSGEIASVNPAPGWSRGRPWLAPPGSKFGVNFVGPVEAIHGLGMSARGYVDAAIASGVPLHVIKWRLGFERVRTRDVKVPTPGEQAINLVHLNLDLIHSAELLDHAPLDRLLSPSHYNIVILLWELPSINPDWVETIHRFDEVWVPSSFMGRALQRVSAMPVRIVRPALSLALPESTDLPFQLPQDRCIFLYAADLGSVAKRKNPEAFWRAYATEFGPNEGAFCIVKLHYADPEQPLLLEIASLAASRPDVLLVTDSLSDREMKSLFARVDCYVSPHRAEGLGLTLLEAMLAGKPVIATGYSGEGDFVREETALLLDYDLIEVGQGAEPYMAGAVWADPKEASLRRRMRQVLNDRGAAQAIGARGRDRAIELFSVDTTSARLKEELARIWEIGGGLIG